MFGLVRFYYEGDGYLCNEMTLVGESKTQLRQFAETQYQPRINEECVISDIDVNDIEKEGYYTAPSIYLILPLQKRDDGIWGLVVE